MCQDWVVIYAGLAVLCAVIFGFGLGFGLGYMAGSSKNAKS